MRAGQKYFIQEHLHREVYHGGIFNVDAEKIFSTRGYKAIEFPGTFDFTGRSKWKRWRYLIKTFFKINSHDLVIFQFPLYARIHQLLITLLRLKGVPIICLILDIDGMRDGNKKLLKKEIKAFRQFNLFIIHNERMQQWLQPIVPKATLAQVQFFDFLTTPAHQHRSITNQIIIAGDLNKTTFIEKLGQLPRLSFSIYGTGYPHLNTAPDNAHFKGMFRPHELVHHLQGAFGLVWYGPEIDSFAGNYGHYLTIVTPHKLSLFIMAGIPIIVPATSASALLVKKYGIGCTIDKLSDIEGVISHISNEEYMTMVANMVPLATQLSQGAFLTQALDQLELTLRENLSAYNSGS